MPMTPQESQLAVEIMLKYMSPRAARDLAGELWERIGKVTANAWVRDTLESINSLADTQDKLPDVPRGVYAAWVSLFASHWIVAAGNLISAAAIMLCTIAGRLIPNWALAFPVTTFVVWATFSRVYDCPLTTMDNALRRQYGLPPIKAFLKHYLVDPLRRAWRLP